MTRQRHGLEAASFTGAMWALAGLGVLLLILPTLVVVVVSFTSGFSLRFPPQGYSLRWYYALLDAWQLHFAAANSFEVACWTTVLAIILGVAAALAIARSQRWTARVLDSVFMSPLVLPALAFGLASLMFFSTIGLPISLVFLVAVLACVAAFNQLGRLSRGYSAAG